MSGEWRAFGRLSIQSLPWVLVLSLWASIDATATYYKCTKTNQVEAQIGLLPHARRWFEVCCPFYLHRCWKDSNAFVDTLLRRMWTNILNGSNTREEHVSCRGFLFLCSPEAWLGLPALMMQLGLDCHRISIWIEDGSIIGVFGAGAGASLLLLPRLELER